MGKKEKMKIAPKMTGWSEGIDVQIIRVAKVRFQEPCQLRHIVNDITMNK